MDWAKCWTKRKIGWARSDVKFCDKQIEHFNDLLKIHTRNQHDGKLDNNCQICEGYQSIIRGFESEMLEHQEEIRSYLRGK